MKQSEHATPSGAQHNRARMCLRIAEEAVSALNDGTPADVFLAGVYKQNKKFGSRDRRFYSNAVFSYFRWLGWTQQLAKPSLPVQVALSSLLDAAELSPPLAALCEQASLTDIPPLGTRTLPEKAEAIQPLLAGNTRPLISQLVPSWVNSALPQPVTGEEEHTARCIEHFQKRLPTWIRVPRSGKEALIAALGKDGSSVLTPDTMKYAVGSYSRFHHPSLEKEIGTQFEIQDLASQCVGLLCAPRPGQTWWDACAGSGGKALHLASMMEKRGDILATDRRPQALRELQRRVRRNHVKCIEWHHADATKVSTELKPFDGILVDAPCSGIGTWARNPDARWRTSEKDVASRARLQARLLESTSHYVKPGGLLVYSVCTLTSAETSDVVQDFLKTHPDFKWDAVPHPLNGSQTDGEVWIWPWDGPCDGMYVARMARDQ